MVPVGQMWQKMDPKEPTLVVPMVSNGGVAKNVKM